jgi:hypothetical protein
VYLDQKLGHNSQGGVLSAIYIHISHVHSHDQTTMQRRADRTGFA